MTLYEAIENLLQQKGRAMTTIEIANELNSNKWYRKKDGSEISAFQIHGRTRNYPKIFVRAGSIVSLSDKFGTSILSYKNYKKKPKKPSSIISDSFLIEKNLMDAKNYKNALEVDKLVPNKPGVYCIQILNVKQLPMPFSNLLSDRKHKILYIGIASRSLKRRFLHQELRAKGHGTFFRNIGAVLGYKPEMGSLAGKANKRNYTFSLSDQTKIIEWINNNLLVNWIEFDGDFGHVESVMIQRQTPLLNLAKNPLALTPLRDLRGECVRIANS